MKNSLFLLLLCMVAMTVLNGQSFDDKYKTLRQALDTIKVDSSTFTELYGSQLDEVFMDLKQINEAIRVQNDSLLNQLNHNNVLVNELKAKNRMLFYLIIATSSIILILIVVLIIHLMKGGAWKKKYNVLLSENDKIQTDVQKIKQAKDEEKKAFEIQIEKLNTEKEKLTAVVHRMQDEINNKNIENTTLQEKLNLCEQKISDLQNELMQEHSKCEELSAYINDLLEIKNEKELFIEQLKSEIKQINETTSHYTSTIQQLEEQIAVLKQENNELLQRAVKAAETEEKVNNELKKFIAELQAMLPLPKND